MLHAEEVEIKFHTLFNDFLRVFKIHTTSDIRHTIYDFPAGIHY